MRIGALFVALVVIAGARGEPKDACALLKPTEIQALAPNAKIGTGKASKGPLDDASCEYEWGAGGNVQSGHVFFHLTVAPTAKLFPGMNAATIKQGLLSDPKSSPVEVNGIGDAAVFQSNAPIRAEASAVVKGQLLTVFLESSDARAQKDKLIGLLKTAAGRL